MPRDTFRVATTVDIPQVEGLMLGGTLRWQSGIHRDVAFPETRIEQDAYTIVGLMARYEFADRWSATLNLDNVTDEKYIPSLYWDQALLRRAAQCFADRRVPVPVIAAQTQRRLSLASRVLAALVGGYAFAHAATAFLTLALPFARADRVIAATLARVRRVVRRCDLRVHGAQGLARVGGPPRRRCAVVRRGRRLPRHGGTPMKHNATQALSWLHTWSGLLVGWLLFVIFAGGTIACFDKELDYWMQPSLHGRASPQAPAFDKAVEYLQKKAPDAHSWYLLVGDRDPALQAYTFMDDGTETRVALDPVTGDVLPSTAGGDFFFSCTTTCTPATSACTSSGSPACSRSPRSSRAS